MKISHEGWNLVVAGFWNRLIFIPEWMHPRLFPNPEIETLISLLPVIPLIYRDNEVAMEISSARLLFHPRAITDVGLSRIEKMARTVLQDLPETPIQAVGFNFRFLEEQPDDNLLSLFNTNDQTIIAELSTTINERIISRKLDTVHGVLNYKLSLSADGNITFDFNFHTDVTLPGTAIAALEEGRIRKLKEFSLEFLSKVYNLNLED